jgi:hypothetical protein
METVTVDIGNTGTDYELKCRLIWGISKADPDRRATTTTTCPGQGCMVATEPGAEGYEGCSVTSEDQTCTVVLVQYDENNDAVTTTLPPTVDSCGEASHEGCAECTVPL